MNKAFYIKTPIIQFKKMSLIHIFSLCNYDRSNNRIMSFNHAACFLQVVCVSNFFEQPMGPVVCQEEEATHTSLQEHPANGNHYGST